MAHALLLLLLLQTPPGGALTGERYRVIVSTDIGGSDPDDFQSMVHYLVYADLFDTEGLISSPPGAGRKEHLLEALAEYEKDYANLSSWATYPTPDALRAVSKQGAVNTMESLGQSTPPGTISDGAQHLVNRANAADGRPLYVLVWGSMTDVAQAVHKDPTIKSKLRVYSTGSWNTGQDNNARDYVYNNHPDLWWIESDSTFRGMYNGGDQTGDLGNSSFPANHVANHGALGDFFMAKKSSIKMGDTPTLLYLFRGNPSDPGGDSWGGAYIRPLAGSRPSYWHDDPDAALKEGSYNGAKTVNRWRADYLRDWQDRMDRAKSARTGNAPPAASDQNVSVPHDTSVPVTLGYSDPDGPGPYSFTVISPPSHGTLTGSGSDRTYTPTSGYSGSDSFTWKVNDGLADSNTATVSLSVAAAPGSGTADPVANTSPSSYEWDILAAGVKQYIDRTYTFSAVPPSFTGLDYLRTANDDKGSSGASFITFDLAGAATVYVAHDDRFVVKPSWLGAFSDTGEDLLGGGETFSLFAREYAGGTVTLGGNTDDGVARNSMYGVVLGPAGGAPGGGGSGPVDSDGDGLTDADESSIYGTNPQIADTDGDGVSDGAEVAAGTDPLAPPASGAPAVRMVPVEGEHGDDTCGATGLEVLPVIAWGAIAGARRGRRRPVRRRRRT